MNISYKEGVKILFNDDNEHNVKYVNKITNEVLYEETSKSTSYCPIRYFVKWVIKVDDKIIDNFDLTEKKVLIRINSDKTIGDLIAFAPYSVEFKKLNNCDVYLYTPNNYWFSGLEGYKTIKFVEEKDGDYYVIYDLGCFKKSQTEWNTLYHRENKPNTLPLQKMASDILGLPHIEINLGLAIKPLENDILQKYVVISPDATMRCKQWTDRNWMVLTNELISMGYKVISITKHPHKVKGVINFNNISIHEIVTLLYYSEFLIGLSSGISWINWALKKHTFMIAGFTKPTHEFTENNTRLFVENICVSCWTHPDYVFNSDDFDWCPLHKFTDNEFICQQAITPMLV
jgi:autotransporter strand-loop-strand O-heptosyltransferase